jgi:hypothetical protein
LSQDKETGIVLLVTERTKGGKNMGNTDTTRLIAALRSKGFTVKLTGNIWIIRNGDEFVAAMSTSTHDLRALKNALGAIADIELTPPEGE